MLTSLPTEVRLQILQLSIGEHIYHISDIEHHENDSKRTEIALMRCDCCLPLGKRNLQALTLTCRLLTQEAKEIFYRQTTLIFASMDAVDTFFRTRADALHNVYSISISCGPAKHLSRSCKRDKRRVMRLLQNHAYRIAKLHLCFRSYYGMEQDKQLLSNFWSSNIGRFRGLRRFSIDIDLDMLGPMGAVHISSKDQAYITLKSYHTQHSLSTQVCKSFSGRSNDACTLAKSKRSKRPSEPIGLYTKQLST